MDESDAHWFFFIMKNVLHFPFPLKVALPCLGAFKIKHKLNSFCRFIPWIQIYKQTNIQLAFLLLYHGQDHWSMVVGGMPATTRTVHSCKSWRFIWQSGVVNTRWVVSAVNHLIIIILLQPTSHRLSRKVRKSFRILGI